MTPPVGDLHGVLVEAVRQRLQDGDWQMVAVAPARLLSGRLRAELDRTFGALRDPVLVVLERVADPGEDCHAPDVGHD